MFSSFLDLPAKLHHKIKSPLSLSTPLPLLLPTSLCWAFPSAGHIQTCQTVLRQLPETKFKFLAGGFIHRYYPCWRQYWWSFLLFKQYALSPKLLRLTSAELSVPGAQHIEGFWRFQNNQRRMRNMEKDGKETKHDRRSSSLFRMTTRNSGPPEKYPSSQLYTTLK